MNPGVLSRDLQFQLLHVNDQSVTGGGGRKSLSSEGDDDGEVIPNSRGGGKLTVHNVYFMLWRQSPRYNVLFAPFLDHVGKLFHSPLGFVMALLYGDHISVMFNYHRLPHQDFLESSDT